MVDYVLKPVDPAEFHKTMERGDAGISKAYRAEKEKQGSSGRLSEKVFLSRSGSIRRTRRVEENLAVLTEDPQDILNRLYKDDPCRGVQCVF